jgi:hypothetical protein
LAEGQEPALRQDVTMNKDLIAKLLGIGLILAAVFFGKTWRPNAEDAKYNAHPERNAHDPHRHHR